VTAVHQFVPSLLPGDATGAHTLEVRRIVQEMGLESEVFAQYMRGPLAKMAHHFSEYPRWRKPGDVLLHQLATCSDMADFLYARPEPLAVNYHNVTPGRFFKGWDPVAATYQDFGRAQVARLADKTVLAIAVSRFNEADLLELGYGATTVVPVLVDLAALDSEVDEDTASRLLDEKASGGADILFVGRIVPNKAQHELVKAFYAYRRLYDPRARLHLVGRSEWEHYDRAVRDLVAKLDLEGAVRMPGLVSQAELAAYYRAADVFASASEHEGFCVPLLEAMHHRVPVVARAEAAVPETLDGAGVLVGTRSPLHLAAAIHRVVADPELSSRLAEAGRRRLAAYDLASSRWRMSQALETLLASVQ
jgi:glycosyltransferase involved in cell wall biosynthesis